jgi:predicted O-methyltransferase YrrM
MKVWDYHHFEKYLREPGDVLTDIERDNLDRGIALIGPSVGKLLYMACKMINARKVLELGTANGYSTIWIARAVGPGGKVVGTEYDPETAAIAMENFRRTGVSDIASVMVGDAIKYLRNCRETFDLVFLDIEKEDYSSVLDDCVRVLRPGGVLFADNVAFDTAGDFNDRLNGHPELETSFISGQFINHDPDSDTISISRKRR